MASDAETALGDTGEEELLDLSDVGEEERALPAYLTPADIPKHVSRKLLWAHLKAGQFLSDVPPEGSTKESILEQIREDIALEAKLSMPQGYTDDDIPEGITRGLFIEALKDIDLANTQKTEAIQIALQKHNSPNPSDPMEGVQPSTTPQEPGLPKDDTPPKSKKKGNKAKDRRTSADSMEVDDKTAESPLKLRPKRHE